MGPAARSCSQSDHIWILSDGLLLSRRAIAIVPRPDLTEAVRAQFFVLCPHSGTTVYKVSPSTQVLGDNTQSLGIRYRYDCYRLLAAEQNWRGKTKQEHLDTCKNSASDNLDLPAIQLYAISKDECSTHMGSKSTVRPSRRSPSILVNRTLVYCQYRIIRTKRVNCGFGFFHRRTPMGGIKSQSGSVEAKDAALYSATLAHENWFTQGTPNISDATGLGNQFAGFYKQFIDAFDLHGNVPYVADAFIQRKNLDYYNLKGLAINNAVVGDHIIQLQATVSPFVDYWEKLFYLNGTFTAQMHAAHETCGFAGYIDKYFTYPAPQEPFKLPEQLQDKRLPCNIFGDVLKAARLVNPCFNTFAITLVYQILTTFTSSDKTPVKPVRGSSRISVKSSKTTISLRTFWEQCTKRNVFGGAGNDPNLKDTTFPPALNGVLQRVIEYTNNTFIGNGDLDFLLSTNSTLLAIQNITWNGFQGFQKYPDKPLYAPYHPEYELGSLAGAGILGRWGSERGVTFYSTRLGGHELPGYTPGAGYRVMEVFLGNVANLSVVSDFTTQKGDYGNNASENEGTKAERSKKDTMPKDEL
nr:putative serine carboxypeptidase [Quercus suber]